ncbi:metal dependent phosphohydrolase [Nitrosopumilus maritimus SCM1]|uniref:Metal dependent phosphohydrolase n=1 Tax=Nitrosopumilus maritimus (strain SCM1) TaxID=436308 RepID=A9A5V1_NITMS|nr:metal dependent phosphohydrolase [Nitrosopumilus maritimus SCM1]
MSKIDFKYKSIRDPLYGFIDISKTEQQVIDSSPFRRLLNIKQLSHAFVVYPTAIHTRFEHSLGATHLAGKVCDQLNFDDTTKEIVRLAALLHDVGHGPYSHLFESVISNVNENKIDHEWISMLIISKNPELQSILGDKSQKIIQLLDHKPVSDWDSGLSTLASDVISSALDVDKMDYLRRDSYHIGVAYGQFDLARIIHTITSTETDEQRICIQDKGKDSIENYRLGRYLMHAQVYQHHARLTADQMFLRALDLATNEEEIIPIDKLKADNSTLNGNDEFLEYYLKLNDKTIYDEIINTKPDSKSARILKNIQKRNLLKRACEILPDKEIENAIIRDQVMKMDYSKLKQFAAEMSQSLGLEYSDTIAYLSKIPVGLYDGEILVLWKNIPRKLDDFSPITVKNSAIERFFVFGDSNKDNMNAIETYVKNKFGMDN